MAIQSTVSVQSEIDKNIKVIKSAKYSKLRLEAILNIFYKWKFWFVSQNRTDLSKVHSKASFRLFWGIPFEKNVIIWFFIANLVWRPSWILIKNGFWYQKLDYKWITTSKTYFVTVNVSGLPRSQTVVTICKMANGGHFEFWIQKKNVVCL